MFIPSHIKFIAFLFFFGLSKLLAQSVLKEAVLQYDFNEKLLKEKNNKLPLKHSSVALTTDRFGNADQAFQTFGNENSYLNFGTSDQFKQPTMSISLWVKYTFICHFGKGYTNNPILIINNKLPGYDFINAYTIMLEMNSSKLGFALTKDSMNYSNMMAKESIEFNQWHHLVVMFNDDKAEFYLDGVLQGSTNKKFKMEYSDTDSLMLGVTADLKNQRYSAASFDDIRFYHRMLSPKEVNTLYHEPNPNQFKVVLKEAIKYGGIILFFVAIIIYINYRNKLKLKQQKELLSAKNKIAELEMKVVKAQMNPHFMSNCLAAIQELFYSDDKEKAAQYLAKFSYFLRRTLIYSDQTYTTLKEELDILHLYIELEQLRFKDGFSFEVKIDETINTSEVKIPTFILQPFLENAIWHGLLPLKGKRSPIIHLNFYRQSSTIQIEVIDNGIGRDLKNIERKSISKGTKLVNEKIESINNLSDQGNYTIRTEDLKGENENIGTKVVISLPCISSNCIV